MSIATYTAYGRRNEAYEDLSLLHRRQDQEQDRHQGDLPQGIHQGRLHAAGQLRVPRPDGLHDRDGRA